MNIIIFGPQGSGKGTQADLVCKRFKMYHLSMGDELRKEIKKGTPLGKRIASIINGGNLVPDSISNKIVADISKRNRSILFDGYPRRKTQLLYIIRHFRIDAAIEIDISEKESIKRIATRRMCPECGRNYNIITIKPKKAGYCDVCKARLIHRDDDKPKEIRRRLKIYHSQTEPLKKYYSGKGLLHVIDGERPIVAVNKDMVKILGPIKPY